MNAKSQIVAYSTLITLSGILLLPCLCAAQSGRKPRSTNQPTAQTGDAGDTAQTISSSSSSPAANQQSGAPGIGFGTVLTGRRIKMPAPKYPKAARKQNVQGVVVVQITVDESGKVISAEAISGPQLLHEAAVIAAYKARFTPTLLAGHPVKVTGTLSYNFVLD